MLDFEKTLDRFLQHLEKFQGAVPTITISYRSEEITIVDSPSGFLRQLYADDRFVGHLRGNRLSVKFFK